VRNPLRRKSFRIVAEPEEMQEEEGDKKKAEEEGEGDEKKAEQEGDEQMEEVEDKKQDPFKGKRYFVEYSTPRYLRVHFASEKDALGIPASPPTSWPARWPSCSTSTAARR